MTLQPAKSAVRLAAAGAALLALAGCASGPDAATLGRLGWMVGCWESADAANRETWSAPAGAVMFGHATTMKNGQLAFFEQSRIDLRQARAVYTASPDGQRPVDFVENPASAAGPASITFENAQQDYPQRIAYRKDGKGLAATISTLDGSRPTEYRWTRCAS
jgi:hypothetical protein